MASVYNNSLVPLIQKPESPDKSIKKGTIGEAQVARLSHVNALAKDVYQIKSYILDLNTGSVGQMNICSKKGMVEIINLDLTSEYLYISLVNPEIDYDKDKVYVQLTAYSNSQTAVPVIFGAGASTSTYNVKIVNSVPGDWGIVYFYYELIKIC